MADLYLVHWVQSPLQLHVRRLLLAAIVGPLMAFREAISGHPSEDA
jgi:hypothetical protein